jgi:NADPH-dependent ferric siderophore reductase
MSSGQSFGDSDDSPADEAAMHAIAALMEEIQPDSIVTKFVLLVETIEEEDRYFSALGYDGYAAVRTMHRGLPLRDDRTSR